jgi:hypothetical protein
MSAVVGPVLIREGGYAFDVWTPERGLSCSFRYRRAEDAYYARRVEIRHFARPDVVAPVSCDTVDEFLAALALRRARAERLGAA